MNPLRDSMPPGVADVPPMSALWGSFLDPALEREFVTDAVIADHFGSATVLFSDIVGLTQLSVKLTAEELVKRLDEIFTRFDEIAEELGLEKIKTIGDAYMVCGGVPLARPDHAETVCEMAVRMRDCIDALEGDLRVRIGVHTGPVVAGVVRDLELARLMRRRSVQPDREASLPEG